MQDSERPPADRSGSSASTAPTTTDHMDSSLGVS